MGRHEKMLLSLMLLSLHTGSLSLENGLARTPPMGWLSWERFRCNTDCVNDPQNCISENLMMQMADVMASEGYSDVGYKIVSIDDCWLAEERDANGKLQPDPTRFPSGMKALGDYIHNLGLQFGIYEDYGTLTCAGYPGVLGHMETDANTFAEWTADYVKLDGCYSDPATMDSGYPTFGTYLNKTGRPMVYMCEWPFYQVNAGISPDWNAIIETCNLWRNFGDVEDSWASVEQIIDYFGDNQDSIVPNAGPGHWNDPDMLIIGDFGLSYEQSKAQMAMWTIFAAPLIMSVDLRTIRSEYKDILQNTAVIAVNQDPLGIQGKRIQKENNFEIWIRPLSPVQGEFYSYAIAFLNRRTDGTPYKVSVTPEQLGLTAPGGYTVVDLFEDVNYGLVKSDMTFEIAVNPTGVSLLRFNVMSSRYSPFFRRWQR